MYQFREGRGQNGQYLLKLSEQTKYYLKSEYQLGLLTAANEFENGSSGVCRSSFLYSVKQGP